MYLYGDAFYLIYLLSKTKMKILKCNKQKRYFSDHLIADNIHGEEFKFHNGTMS